MQYRILTYKDFAEKTEFGACCEPDMEYLTLLVGEKRAQEYFAAVQAYNASEDKYELPEWAGLSNCTLMRPFLWKKEPTEDERERLIAIVEEITHELNTRGKAELDSRWCDCDTEPNEFVEEFVLNAFLEDKRVQHVIEAIQNHPAVVTPFEPTDEEQYIILLASTGKHEVAIHQTGADHKKSWFVSVREEEYRYFPRPENEVTRLNRLNLCKELNALLKQAIEQVF